MQELNAASKVDTRLFRRAVIVSVVGGVVVALAVPPLLSAVWGVPSNFPGGARFALAAAWGTLVLFWVSLLNLKQIAGGGNPVEFNTPVEVTRWLHAAALGIAAVEVGFAISTTVFK